MRDAGQRRRPCRGTQEGEEDAGGDTRAGRNVAPFTRCGPRPGTSESDRVRRRGLCETIKTRLFRRSLIRSDGVCIKRGDPEAATPQEKPRVDRAETTRCVHTPRTAKRAGSPQKLGGPGPLLPRKPPGGTGPAHGDLGHHTPRNEGGQRPAVSAPPWAAPRTLVQSRPGQGP